MTIELMEEARKLLIYAKGTLDYSLKYERGGENVLVEYTV